MLLTVAICTWNRAPLLRKTLEQMTQLIAPASAEWELLVVNNNCTDDTVSVIEHYADRLPLRRLFEAEPGLSNARNTAIREAKGEYVVWTDDDVLVDAHWLAGYTQAFRRWPEASVFGGPIEPWFEGEPPRWVKESFSYLEGVFAVRNLGSEAVALSRKAYPFGANMAIRRDVYERFTYDPELGRRPGDAMGGEEMVLMWKLFDAGEQGRWVPDARVRHWIPRERQTLTYVREYFLGGGRLLAKLHTELPGKVKVLGSPLWLWKQALVNEAGYRVRRLFARPEVWIADLTLASLSWGQLRGNAAGLSSPAGKRAKEATPVVDRRAPSPAAQKSA